MGLDPSVRPKARLKVDTGESEEEDEDEDEDEEDEDEEDEDEDEEADGDDAEDEESVDDAFPSARLPTLWNATQRSTESWQSNVAAHLQQQK